MKHLLLIKKMLQRENGRGKYSCQNNYVVRKAPGETIENDIT